MKRSIQRRRLEREQSWEFIGDRPASWAGPSTTPSTSTITSQTWSSTRLSAANPDLCSSPPQAATPAQMDPRRRVGPRAQAPPPPESRNTAYENIFGRPSAAHHLGQTNTHQYGGRGNGGLGYSPSLRQPASTSSLAPSQVAAHYRQQYHHQHQHQNQQINHQTYTNYYSNYNNNNNNLNSGYSQNYIPQLQLAPPSVHSRARSFAGSPHSGDIVPQPAPSPDPTLERYTRQGMTPAQAYQAQVYSNDRQTHPRAEPSRASLPRLEILEVDTDGGNLDLDFVRGPSNANGSHVPRDLDESDSELPWAGNAGQRTPTIDSARRTSSISNYNATASSSHAKPFTAPLPDASGKALPKRPYTPSISTTSTTSPTSSIGPSNHQLNVDPAYSPLSPLSEVTSSPARRSSESAKTMPPMGNFQQRLPPSDRGRSLSASQGSSARTPEARRRREPKGAPVVYAALLSKVAEAFRARMLLSERVKDGLAYPDAFDGAEAVDKICFIIKTTDRSLALLLGRALDAQKFFHDVTYDHRLRDNPNEIYQFRARLPSPFTSDADGPPAPGGEQMRGSGLSSSGSRSSRPMSPESAVSSTVTSRTPSSIVSNGSSATSVTTHAQGLSQATTIAPASSASAASGAAGEDELPTGVFTMLTECYSSTCSTTQLCYSITCPRRMEQQHRLNMKPQRELKPQISQESLGEGSGPDAGTLWIHSVPKEIADTLSETEKKRQEAINEVIYTERDFVRDMEYLKEVWVKRLQSSDVISPAQKRDHFISQVFWNLQAIIDTNTRLRDALTKRQKQFAVVSEIGDIVEEHVPQFDPFVDYGAHQLYGKYEFEKEKSANPAFAAFVEETERLPESRKLELNGYLTKPTTRLARYPLLLEAVLKHTPEGSPDKIRLPEVIKTVRGFLAKVNQKSGEAENRFHLHQLERQLVFRPGEFVDLQLPAEHRQLIYKGSLNRRGGAGDKEELQVFLFDHAVLMVKQKTKADQHKVYRRPIPLELLVVSTTTDDTTTTMRAQTTRAKSTLSKAVSVPAVVVRSDNSRNGYPITFQYLGWRGYSITLWAPTPIGRKKWMDQVQKQQEALRERSTVFETTPFSDGFFTGPNRVNCAAPFNQGRRIAYGTDDGVYFSDFRENGREPVKVLALLEVTQVDILEEYQLLVILTERTVMTFPLDALDPMDPTAALKRGKRIASHTSFFKAGICLNRTLICVVKTSALSTTVKTFEPIDQNIRGKNKPTFRKLLQGGNDTLRLFKEFYIPVESHSLTMLKTRLCMGCTKGFLIVDLETLDTQPLVDPTDPSLEFIEKKDNLRPLAIFRVDTEFLLCYDEWAVFVDKRGFRARGEWKAVWEGRPTAFAFHYPYVIAFEPGFIEVWDIITCRIQQVIPSDNLRCLFAEPPPSGSHPPPPSMYYHPHSMPHPPHQHPPGPVQYNVHPNGPISHYPPVPQQTFPPGPPMHQNHPMIPQQHLQGIPPQQPVVPGFSPGYGSGRREILLVSDDNVMFLKRAFPSQSSADGAPMSGPTPT